MPHGQSIRTSKKASDTAAFVAGGAKERSCPATDEDSRIKFSRSSLGPIRANQPENQALKVGPDRAILRLARALARQAAREDHERECADKARENETCRDLRPLLDRPSG